MLCVATHNRKSWIHVGHPKAGPKVAAILSVVESCRRRKIPVRDYLGDVLPGLAETTLPRLPDLTPAAWAATRWRCARPTSTANVRTT